MLMNDIWKLHKQYSWKDWPDPKHSLYQLSLQIHERHYGTEMLRTINDMIVDNINYSC